jgi:hypothetical protein
MAYKCPRCGIPLFRTSDETIEAGSGDLGSILYMAFGPFRCLACGEIRTNDFPVKIQRRILFWRYLKIAIFVSILFLAFWSVSK